MSLNNKVAIVTGGSSGIGAAIAEKFVECGARVAIVGRNSTKLSNVEKKLKQKGGEPLVINADVTNEDDARRIINDTLKQFGKIDILINNAGVGGFLSILSENVLEEFDKIMSTNVRAVVHLTHLAAPHLIKTKGNVVNISSVAARSVSNRIAYPTSKAALDHFTRCVARELAPKGVRVNTVNPGPVHSDFLENAGITNEQDRESVKDDLTKSMPLQRIGEAEEIADFVEFVVSDRGRSITGSSLISDNGLLLINFTLPNTDNK